MHCTNFRSVFQITTSELAIFFVVCCFFSATLDDIVRVWKTVMVATINRCEYSLGYGELWHDAKSKCYWKNNVSYGVIYTHKHSTPSNTTSLLRLITTLSNIFSLEFHHFVSCFFLLLLLHKQNKLANNKQWSVWMCVYFFFLICSQETSHNKSQQARQ